jgi:aryl-alcohol dehydrogenase-like predicted oxidoreductase
MMQDEWSLMKMSHSSTSRTISICQVSVLASVAWKRPRLQVLPLIFLVVVILSSLLPPSTSGFFCPCRRDCNRHRRARGSFRKDADVRWRISDSTRAIIFKSSRTRLSESPFLSQPPQGDDGSTWRKCHAESNFWRSVYKKVHNDLKANNNNDNNNDNSNGMLSLARDLPSVETLDVSGPLPPGAYYRSSCFSKEVSSSAKPKCRISLAIDISKDKNNVELDSSEMVKTMQSCLEDGLSSFQLLVSTSTTSSTSSFTTSEQQQQWVEENVYQRLLAETPAFALNQCHLTMPYFLQHHGSGASSSAGATTSKERPSTTPNMSTQSTQKLLRQQVAESLLRMGGAESIDCLQLIEPPTQDPAAGDVSRLYHLDVLDAVQDLQREGLVQTVSLAPSRYSVENQAALAWKTRGGSSSSTTLWSNNIVDSVQIPFNLLERDDALAFYNILEQQQQQQAQSNDNEKRLILPAILASSPLADGFLTDRFVHEEPDNLSLQLLGSERYAFEDYIRATTTTTTSSSTSSIISKVEMSNLWNHYQNKLLPALTEMAWKHGVSSGAVSCVSLRWLLQFKNNHVASAVVPTSLMEASDNASQGYDSYMKRNGRFRQRRPKSLYKRLRDVFTFQLDEEDLDRLAQLSQDFAALKPASAKKKRNNAIAFDPMHAEWQQEDPESYFREVFMENGGDVDDIDFRNPKLWL